MPKDRVEVQLAHLKTIKDAGCSEAGLADLRKALSDRVNVITAKAAAIAGEWQARALLPDLLKAFHRLFEKGAETDPQCWGKNGISKALKDLGYSESAAFLAGLKHIQLEATWEGATIPRRCCAEPARWRWFNAPDIPRYETMLHLVDALTEIEARVRTDAARALEQMGGRDAAILLRLKARGGDKESRVTGEVLEALLALEGESGIAFAASFLEASDEEVAEEAALALGASRLPRAVEVLKEQWLRTQGRRNGPALLRAISASRQDSALTFLLEQIEKGRSSAAEHALLALELHRDSEEIATRVAAAVAQRPELEQIFRERFSAR